MFYVWRNSKNEQKLNVITAAFGFDNYMVDKVIEQPGRLGIRAIHKTAFNYDTLEPKKAYYLEGSSYDMGYMMGLLAEKEISSMAVDFTDKVIFDFIKERDQNRGSLLMDMLLKLLNTFTKGMFNQLSVQLRDEINGLYDGCKAANQKTNVTINRLVSLNFDIDVLCSLVYTGAFILKSIPNANPSYFRIPLACNGFSVFGNAAGNGHYFGRDFMFTNAGVFQNNAATIIYNPKRGYGREAYPMVSIGAPGMIGSIAGMNIFGVGMGVNMSPGANCTPGKIGTNSLLLARTCLQYGDSAEEAVRIMVETPRGVSWNYIIADGNNDRACVVEAGASDIKGEFTSYPPSTNKQLLPDRNFLRFHKSAEYNKGLMVRWNDYKYPREYLDFNPGLCRDKRKPDMDCFSERGYINKSFNDKNCPSTNYFAPQREARNDVVIVTNHYVIPEMRFFSMYPWTSRIIGDSVNEIQWRYDELNNEILSAIQNKGYINFECARGIIDFLSPYGRFPAYYSKSPKSRDGMQVQIKGSVSLFDLKQKVSYNHYGYYCDEWVRTSLPNYLV